jgi:hypothetical protein
MTKKKIDNFSFLSDDDFALDTLIELLQSAAHTLAKQ